MLCYSNIDSDEASVFEAFSKGDAIAFKHFFECHHRALYLFVLGRMEDPEDAKDIVAEAFATLAQNRLKIKDQDHLYKYLYTVARNEATDYFRKMDVRRRGQNEISRMTETVYSEPAESEIVHAIRLAKVAVGVQKLPPDRRRIFKLFYFIRRDVRSIANQLNLKEQTIRNQLSRAIHELRKTVQ